MFDGKIKQLGEKLAGYLDTRIAAYREESERRRVAGGSEAQQQVLVLEAIAGALGEMAAALRAIVSS